MNTKAIAGILVGILVIGGGIWYATTHQSATTPTEVTQQEQASTTPSAGSGSLKDLLALAGAVQCDVSSTDSANPFAGKVYVSGGKMRVDATAHIEQLGKDVHTHMVRADGFFYTWSDLMPQGIKIAETAATQSDSAQAQGVSASTKVSYTCTPWIPDSALLTPPTNITFVAAPTAP